MNLFQRYKAWRQKRYWQSRQLEHLAMLIRGDARWLAHDKTARGITERYEAALRDDWYKLAFEGSDQLRRRLGLEPTYVTTARKQPQPTKDRQPGWCEGCNPENCQGGCNEERLAELRNHIVD